VALISTLHSLYSKDAFEKNIISVWAERLLLKNRYALVAVSRYVLEDYLHYVPFKGKTFVLYNFLPDSFFQKHKRLKSGELKCVAIGNLKEAKNYPFLLDIFKELKGSGISLDVYGEGLLRNQLQDQIHREGLQVKLCGETNSISDVLSQYDLFIQASSHEGFGISVIEAMAASLPVYVSDIPVFREITGNFAFFFSLSSPNSAAQNLKDFKENVALRNQHVKQAYNYCRLHYSEKIYKQKLQQIYNDVTSGS
jgi:glycosyltransferase involved in cell wall biosynthesis